MAKCLDVASSIKAFISLSVIQFIFFIFAPKLVGGAVVADVRRWERDINRKKERERQRARERQRET